MPRKKKNTGTNEPRQSGRSPQDKMNDILAAVENANWSFPRFLYELFGNYDVDPQSRHGAMLKAFLCGQAHYSAAHIAGFMYGHPLSRPSSNHHDAENYFRLDKTLQDVKFAKPALSIWAIQLLANEMNGKAKDLSSSKLGLRIRAGGIKAAEERRAASAFQHGRDHDVTNPAPADGGIHSSGGQAGGSPGTIDGSTSSGPSRGRGVEGSGEGGGGGLHEGAEGSRSASGGVNDGTARDDDAMDVDELTNEVAQADSAAVGTQPRRPLRKPKGAVSKDPLVSWAVVGKFSIANLSRLYQKTAPVSWQLLWNFLQPDKREESNTADTAEYRPPDVVCTSVISELLYGRNSWTNLFALCRSLALFGTKAHQSMYRVGSRLAQCAPYSTTREALITMSTAQHQALQEAFSDPNSPPPAVVFDNLQVYGRHQDHRIGINNKMLTGTGGTAVVQEDCAPNSHDIDPILAKIEEGARRGLTVTEILDSIDLAHFETVFRYHWLDVLVMYVPDLAVYRSEINKLFEEKAQKHQINKKRHTKVYPLGTNSANEVSTKGLKDALADFLGQLGITGSNIGKRLMFFHGDGKSFEGMLKVKKYLSGSLNEFSTLKFVQPVLELWHTKWTDLSRICRGHWGGEYSTSDPSTLGFMAKAINSPPPTDFHKVDFYTNTRLIDTVVRGLILQAWEVYLGTDDLVEYFRRRAEESKLPSIQALLQDANILSQRYSSTQAYTRALLPPPTETRVEDAPIGPAWLPHERRGQEVRDTPDSSALPDVGASTNADTFKGDWPLANTILLKRSGIFYLEYCRAVALGDIGRVWEVLKVLLFTFAGAGNSNYTVYLIEMFTKIERDFPKPTRDALFNNWLVNLKGKPGHFHELDLMQEHFNHWLEELAQHKGKEFDDPWYRDVLAMHVHQFLHLTEELEMGVRLELRRKSHTEPHKDNELREVIRISRDHDLHHRRTGRDLGFHTEDHFGMGHRKLGAEKKLEEYIEKSMAEWDNKHKRIELPTGYEDASTYLHMPITYENGVMNMNEI